MFFVQSEKRPLPIDICRCVARSEGHRNRIFPLLCMLLSFLILKYGKRGKVKTQITHSLMRRGIACTAFLCISPFTQQMVKDIDSLQITYITYQIVHPSKFDHKMTYISAIYKTLISFYIVITACPRLLLNKNGSK